MKDYTVLVCRYSADGLEEEVNKYLEKGYVLVGGVSAAIYPNASIIWSQAVAIPLHDPQ